MKKITLLLIMLSQAVFAADEFCCRYCTPESKPCGAACIPLYYECKKGEGCACSSANKRSGQGSIYQNGFNMGRDIGLRECKQVIEKCADKNDCLTLLDALATPKTAQN